MPDNHYIEIGKFLKEHREKLSLSQDDVAAKLQEKGLGTSQKVYSNYELGKMEKPPKPEVIIGLAEILEVPDLLEMYFRKKSSKEVKGDTDVSLGIKVTPRGRKQHTQQGEAPDERDIYFEKMRELTYKKYKDMIADNKPQYEMFGDLDLRLYLVEKAIFRRPE